MLYARKITEDSWFAKPALDSDAISELATKNHELSVWKLDNFSNSQKIDDLALALALSRNAVDEFYLVFIDPENLATEYDWHMETSDEDGETGFEEMKSEHTNFMLFSIWDQGFLAEHIHNLIQDSNNYRYYDVSTLVILLSKAVNSNRVNRELLKKKYGKWNKKLIEFESTPSC